MWILIKVIRKEFGDKNSNKNDKLNKFTPIFSLYI